MVCYKRINRVEGEKKKRKKRKRKKIPFHLCSPEPKTRQSLFRKKVNEDYGMQNDFSSTYFSKRSMNLHFH